MLNVLLEVAARDRLLVNHVCLVRFDRCHCVRSKRRRLVPLLKAAKLARFRLRLVLILKLHDALVVFEDLLRRHAPAARRPLLLIEAEAGARRLGLTVQD